MTRRPPPPCCDRCGELCPDGRELRSISGERLCPPCFDEEQDDIADATARGEEYSIGIGTDADDIGLARPFVEREG